MSRLIFDSHAHYDDEQFDSDREALLSSLPDKGVCGIINAAVDEQSAADSIRLTERFSFLYTAVGVHPQAAGGVDPERLCDWIIPLLSHPKVVAVGEIGLDFLGGCFNGSGGVIRRGIGSYFAASAGCKLCTEKGTENQK